MSFFKATSFDTSVDSAEPRVRKMRGLPRVVVWTVMIAVSWVAIVQAVRLFF